MDEQQQKELAAQLRQPIGEPGIQVGLKMNEGNLHINLNTIAALNLEAGDRVLEIGMGNGFFVKDILGMHPDIQYTGCDFSELMIEESKKVNEKFMMEGRASFHLAAADHLSFMSNTFTKIFTVNTIYFWEDYKAVLAELMRVLKPGGSLAIAVRPKSLMQHYPFTRHGFKLFNKEDLVELLVRNHFAISQVIEKDEPAQLIAGNQIPVASLIVVATKS